MQVDAHVGNLTPQTGVVNTITRPATATADLLLDRFLFQVKERTGFGVPDPYPRPNGSGFDFRAGTTWYQVVPEMAGVLLRLKNGQPVRHWWFDTDGRWVESSGDDVVDFGLDLRLESHAIATRLFDWIARSM